MGNQLELAPTRRGRKPNQFVNSCVSSSDFNGMLSQSRFRSGASVPLMCPIWHDRDAVIKQMSRDSIWKKPSTATGRLRGLAGIKAGEIFSPPEEPWHHHSKMRVGCDSGIADTLTENKIYELKHQLNSSSAMAPSAAQSSRRWRRLRNQPSS